ncbi:hypothetical protein F5Y14DRAFT_449023 [Nemania sp. NC0429]|nr:hypothetical protein F5Y14DRAFT_449023 [Nemania sp. NC0429]
MRMRMSTHARPQVVGTLGIAQFILSLSARGAIAQAIQDDSIAYTTLSGWGDMRAFGCKTNACLCRPITLEEGVEFIDQKVVSLCSNYDDQKTATDFLLRYCSNHGYTSVGTPVTPTGSPSMFGFQLTIKYYSSTEKGAFDFQLAPGVI